jgi:hypothetical protein
MWNRQHAEDFSRFTATARYRYHAALRTLRGRSSSPCTSWLRILMISLVSSSKRRSSWQFAASAQISSHRCFCSPSITGALLVFGKPSRSSRTGPRFPIAAIQKLFLQGHFYFPVFRHSATCGCLKKNTTLCLVEDHRAPVDGIANRSLMLRLSASLSGFHLQFW